MPLKIPGLPGYAGPGYGDCGLGFPYSYEGDPGFPGWPIIQINKQFI